MSQYIEFYVGKGDTLIELNSFSRNSSIYRLFYESNSVPYEKVRQITANEVATTVEYIADEIKYLKKNKKEAIKELERLYKATGDFYKNDEVHQTYENINAYIEEVKEDIRADKIALQFAKVFYDMVKDAIYIDDEVKYYFGIESGTNPEIEKIES